MARPPTLLIEAPCNIQFNTGPHLLCSSHVQGSWRFTIRTMNYLIFCHGLAGGGNRSARRKPRCQVGTISRADMPDGSG